MLPMTITPLVFTQFIYKPYTGDTPLLSLLKVIEDLGPVGTDFILNVAFGTLAKLALKLDMDYLGDPKDRMKNRNLTERTFRTIKAVINNPKKLNTKQAQKLDLLLSSIANKEERVFKYLFYFGWVGIKQILTQQPTPLIYRLKVWESKETTIPYLASYAFHDSILRYIEAMKDRASYSREYQCYDTMSTFIRDIMLRYANTVKDRWYVRADDVVNHAKLTSTIGGPLRKGQYITMRQFLSSMTVGEIDRVLQNTPIFHTRVIRLLADKMRDNIASVLPVEKERDINLNLAYSAHVLRFATVSTRDRNEHSLDKLFIKVKSIGGQKAGRIFMKCLHEVFDTAH